MHEMRNFVLVLLLAAGAVWSVLVWLVYPADSLAMPTIQRVIALILTIGMAGWLLYALRIEDKLPDHLSETVGQVYYEADGMCFMPMIRKRGEQAELLLYYQNRFENPAHMVVHLRPPEESFIIRPGWRDVHFAFTAGGGDFGVIHQPIAIPVHLQGEVIDVKVAGVSYYPRSHGARLRKREGLPCGTMLVDWAGGAFKTGVHEVSGEIDLNHPTTMHVSLPAAVESHTSGAEEWRQERISAPRKGA